MTELPRVEFGFERTSCDCPECEISCRFMSGYLIPADLPRLFQAARAHGEAVEDWARRCLMASPGAVVAQQGRVFRIPTLVPRRMGDLTCCFLESGRCAVHAVSPFGCAFPSAHMSQERANEISAHGLRAIVQDMNDDGPYQRLWHMLHREGIVAKSPEESRALMRLAYEKEKHGQPN